MKTFRFSKTYQGRCVLRLPALELPAGTITAVVGANGSGKSTMARVLAGIVPPDGKTPRAPHPAVGYLPQQSYAFRMSVEKNILLNGKDRERAAEMMRALKLDELKKQGAKKLSGGESAKMALIRLLMGRYELLILDEPTAAMDMESTLAAEELIRRACRETGCAALLITHSIRQARRMAERVIVLHKGELIEQGETESVLTAPQQEQTRRFLDYFGT